MQKITIIGRLGRDAAIRETESGTKIVSFTMAVNGRFRGTEKTSWYDVSSFNYDRYRNMIKYLTKGSSVIVTGDLDADIEEGKDGVMRCRRYVTADSIEFNSNGSSGSTREEHTEEAPRRQTNRSRQEDIPDDIPDDEIAVTKRPAAEKPASEKPTARKTRAQAVEPEPAVSEGEEDEEELPF